MLSVPEKYRVTEGAGPYNSDGSFGNNGLFAVPIKTAKKRRLFKVMCSNELGWEHVSASLPDRCPTWEEMCKIKALFWDEEDLVVQYHPPKSKYKNLHPNCLHLWRPVTDVIPSPPPCMV